LKFGQKKSQSGEGRLITRKNTNRGINKLKTGKMNLKGSEQGSANDFNDKDESNGRYK